MARGERSEGVSRARGLRLVEVSFSTGIQVNDLQIERDERQLDLEDGMVKETSTYFSVDALSPLCSCFRLSV